jgi:2'-5' RNA ligase
VAALGEALAGCGHKPDKRHFVPHVTLSRKAKNPRFKAGLPTLDWRVDEFVLAESVAVAGGVRYAVRERWPARA